MKENHRLALIIAFYLSKFDANAVQALGYKGITQALVEIGDILDVKWRTIRNMRDEFDPLHDNPRAGWYQREPIGSRRKVIELFDGLGFEAFTALVRGIIRNPQPGQSAGLEDVLRNIEEKENAGTNARTPRLFTSRGKTGRMAEECFMQCFHQGLLPYDGNLVDRRDDGCGYDFLIVGAREVPVEVKGLAGTNGGILLTDKEWQTAGKMNNYILFLAYNLAAESPEPSWKIIENPAGVLQPLRCVTVVVQTSWQVSDLQISNIN
jgi:hypothetical protein